MEFEPSAWGDTPFFSPSDIILVKQISEGSFGTVYKALYMYQTVAVKVFRQQRDVGILDSHPSGSGTTSLINQMEQEVRILRNLRHKNVVGFLGAVMDPPAIVMDYCESGSLWDVLRRAETNKKIWRKLSWTRRIDLLLGAAQGMAFVHARQGTKPAILHRDLKSPNILLDNKWVVKIADFGLSRFMNSNLNSLWDMMGTNPTWMAPEAIKNLSDCSHEFTQNTDVYPMGIIMWELMTLKRPWYTKDSIPPIPGKILHWVVVEGARPAIPDNPYALPGLATQTLLRIKGVKNRRDALDEYIKLMHSCWDKEPTARPSYRTIVHRLQHIRDLFKGRPPPCLDRIKTGANLTELLNLERRKEALPKNLNVHESFMRNILGGSNTSNSQAQEQASFLSLDGPVERYSDYIRPAYEMQPAISENPDDQDIPSQSAQPETKENTRMSMSMAVDAIPGFDSPFATWPLKGAPPQNDHSVDSGEQEPLEDTNTPDSLLPYPSPFAN